MNNKQIDWYGVASAVFGVALMIAYLADVHGWF